MVSSDIQSCTLYTYVYRELVLADYVLLLVLRPLSCNPQPKLQSLVSFALARLVIYMSNCRPIDGPFRSVHNKTTSSASKAIPASQAVTFDPM